MGNKIIDALAERDLEVKLAKFRINQLRFENESLYEECEELKSRVSLLSSIVIISAIAVNLVLIFS